MTALLHLTALGLLYAALVTASSAGALAARGDDEGASAGWWLAFVLAGVGFGLGVVV